MDSDLEGNSIAGSSNVAPCNKRLSEAGDSGANPREPGPSPTKKGKRSKKTRTVSPIEHLVDPTAPTILNFNSAEVKSDSYRRCLNELSDIGSRFLKIEQELSRRLPSKFGDPVSVHYRPLMYAFETHMKFIAKYCTSKPDVLFVGLNPGPYGMSQNGVPFGELSVVREWFGIDGTVHKPEREHPGKPVLGMDCPKKEVSGERFWGLMRKIFKEPDAFFRQCFVYNYCPIQFMEKSGRNMTFDKLRKSDQEKVYEACDEAIRKVVALFDIKTVIAVGAIVEKRIKVALRSELDSGLVVFRITHPSPANPWANKDGKWQTSVETTLKDKLPEVFGQTDVN